MKRWHEVQAGQGGSYILPFFWMHGEPHEQIVEEIDRVAACGIREICMEARPHPDFAGPHWWRDVDLVIAEAKARGMRVWLLDDMRFPTGHANGAYRDKCPEKAKTYLAYQHMDIIGPARGHSVPIAAVLPDDAGLIAVLALAKPDGETLAVSGEGAIDLTPNLHDGIVHFDLPEGRYRLFVLFTTQTGGGRPHYMNLIDRASVRVLLDEVYEPHYRRYADEFGKTFAGFFSDEPELGNTMWYDFDGDLGKPGVHLPWSRELEDILRARWGERFAHNLPALWYAAGEGTAAVRHAYMDAVSALVRDAFSGQIGAWCEAHGVEYIGHIIEDANAHGRMGCSIGHYFREQAAQHMAGVDVVHCQILPGFTEPVHRWPAGEYDGEFFHFMLAKLASSAARIDANKRGRALCELFGNFGWAEGTGLMKWLSDHMLVRGINHFVPHAFSPTYPDPDCPPHFYARGHNPQYRFFQALMAYLNRAAHLLSGGRVVADAAVLYHADMAWGGGATMLSQKPMRALMERRMEVDVVPCDALVGGAASVADGVLQVNAARYRSIVVPRCDRIPVGVARALMRFEADGVPVFFVDGRPGNGTEREALPAGFTAHEATGSDGCGRVVALGALADRIARMLPSQRIWVDADTKELRTFVVEQQDGCVLMCFNESRTHAVDAAVHLPASTYRTIARVDCVTGETCAWQPLGDAFRCQLEPGQAAFFTLAHADEAPGAKEPEVVSCVRVGEVARGPVVDATNGPVDDARDGYADECDIGPNDGGGAADGSWRVSAAVENSGRFAHVLDIPAGGSFPNMNAPSAMPGFVGVFRYESEFWVENRTRAQLWFRDPGDGVEVWLNGKALGIVLGTGGAVDITDALRAGVNRIRIETANTLVWALKDRASFFLQSGPTGLVEAPWIRYVR